MIDKEFRVVRKNYAVTLGKTHFSVEAYGTYFFTFSPISAVPCGNMEDIDDAESMSFQLSEKEENTIAVWMTSSNLWRRKEYILKIELEGFHYSVRVFGTGSPRDIHYFSGTVIGGKQGAVYETSEYMLTQPHIGIENHYFSMAEDNKISMQLMVPPPLCFPFRTENSQAWFGIGLVADAGYYHFDGFSYRNIQNRAHFSVDLYGAQKVDGEWTAPSIFGCTGKDEWEVLREYAAWHFQSGCHKTEVLPAPWWYGPFFCGWGEQAILKWKYHTDIYGAASEAAYTEMSEHLDALDLHPTVMIIDDKWQEKYGTFLPDCTSVLLYKNEPVGICFANITAGRIANIPLIGMKKEHCGKGLGEAMLHTTLTKLISKHLNHLSEVNASTETDNYPALKMYRRLGFKEDYYYPQAYRPVK